VISGLPSSILYRSPEQERQMLILGNVTMRRQPFPRHPQFIFGKESGGEGVL
jgi:hypothetical protein